MHFQFCGPGVYFWLEFSAILFVLLPVSLYLADILLSSKWPSRASRPLGLLSVIDTTNYTDYSLHLSLRTDICADYPKCTFRHDLRVNEDRLPALPDVICEVCYLPWLLGMTQSIAYKNTVLDSMDTQRRISAEGHRPALCPIPPDRSTLQKPFCVLALFVWQKHSSWTAVLWSIGILGWMTLWNCG